MSKTTIYDVARAANCSPATVSLVINKSPLVNEQTRVRIMGIIDELGYKPNIIARSLITQSTQTIGLIIPDVENPLYAQMISGIEEVAQRMNYDIILGISNEQSEKENYYISLLSKKQVDGLIIFPTHIEDVVKGISSNGYDNVPIVFCGSAYEEADNISYVKPDNRLGAFKAVNHLCETGRKRIGCIFPVANTRQYRSRLAGYKDALLKNGIKYDENMVKICSMESTFIVKATKALMKENPDGIFCLYDYAAIIVMKVIMSLGLKIPEDVSIIGYDNIEISKYLPISLSTVDTQSREVGILATEILIKKIKEHSLKAECRIVEPQLVVRESTVL